MLRLKPEVKEEGVCREIWFALGVATAMRADDTTVTSLTEGIHNPGSLHPKGKAADLRIKDLSNEHAKAWLTVIRRVLEPLGFDVVFEGGVGDTPATTGAHIHIEFDPKVGESFFRRTG